MPKKFGFDKRRAQLSDRINAGHISRDEAMDIIESPVYKSKNDERKEYDYFISKIGLSEEEFENIMSLPITSHYSFSTNQIYGSFLEKTLTKIYRFIKKIFK